MNVKQSAVSPDALGASIAFLQPTINSAPERTRRTCADAGATCDSFERNPYEVLTTQDVADVMKCGVRKIQRMASLGELPMKLFGGEYVMTWKKLTEYLDS